MKKDIKDKNILDFEDFSTTQLEGQFQEKL